MRGKPFEKGKSGNPGGRPKMAEELRARALRAVDEHVMAAWEDEVELRERDVATMGGVVQMRCRGRDWVKAAEMLAAYGMGKPAQPVEHSGKDGESLSLAVRFVVSPGGEK